MRQEWYFIGIGFTNNGTNPGGNGGDCPSFFPLPDATPGAGPAPKSAPPAPTHVHMTAGGYGRCLRNAHTHKDRKPGSL